MYPASTGSIRSNDVVPISRISFSLGDPEKSGPVGVIGAKAIAQATRMPPHAMKGIAYETPVSKCLLNL